MAEVSRQRGGPKVVWGELVLRTSWVRCLAVSAPHLMIVAVPLLWDSHRAGTSDLDVPFFGLLYLALAVFTVGMSRRNAVSLGFGAITIKAGYRTRRLEASDIAAITIERVLRSRYVTVWMRDGTIHRLAPAGRTEGLVRETFDRDWHLIGDWWLMNGGRPEREERWRTPTLAGSGWAPTGFDWRPQY